MKPDKTTQLDEIMEQIKKQIDKDKEEQKLDDGWCNCGERCPHCGKRIRPWIYPTTPYYPPYYEPMPGRYQIWC